MQAWRVEVDLSPHELLADDRVEANPARDVLLKHREVRVRNVNSPELRPTAGRHVRFDLGIERRRIADVAQGKARVPAEPAVVGTVVLPGEKLALRVERRDRVRVQAVELRLA